MELDNHRILTATRLSQAIDASHCMLSASDQFDATVLILAPVWTETDRAKAIALLARALPVTH